MKVLASTTSVPGYCRAGVVIGPLGPALHTLLGTCMHCPLSHADRSVTDVSLVRLPCEVFRLIAFGYLLCLFVRGSGSRILVGGVHMRSMACLEQNACLYALLSMPTSACPSAHTCVLHITCEHCTKLATSSMWCLGPGRGVLSAAHCSPRVLCVCQTLS